MRPIPAMVGGPPLVPVHFQTVLHKHLQNIDFLYDYKALLHFINLDKMMREERCHVR